MKPEERKREIKNVNAEAKEIEIKQYNRKSNKSKLDSL